MLQPFNSLRPNDHKCVDNLKVIASDNGLAPGRRQATIGTNDGILSIGSSGTNFSDVLIEIHTFSMKKMHLKMSSAKWRPFCPGLNVLRIVIWTIIVLSNDVDRCTNKINTHENPLCDMPSGNYPAIVRHLCERKLGYYIKLNPVWLTCRII